MDTTRTTLIPLNSARGRLLPQFCGKQVTTGTLSRWVHRGLAAAYGERIRLRVVYVGRTPHVSAEMVDEFFQRVTAARLDSASKAQHCDDPTDSELRAAGLIDSRRRKSASDASGSSLSNKDGHRE